MDPVAPSRMLSGANAAKAPDRAVYGVTPAGQGQRGAPTAEFTLETARSLATLAEANMLGLADVVFLAGLPKSTLSRLWHDTGWLNTVSGANLQRLISVVPGLAAYVESRSHSLRLELTLLRCAESGLQVQHGRLLAMVQAGHSVQHLTTVLEAAAAVMRMELRDTVANLSRCWGLPQSHALDAVFALSPDALVAQPRTLTDNAMRLIDRVDSGNAIRPTIGIGILVHKLTRLTGAVPEEPPAVANRSSAFAYRSRIIGIILSRADIDVAVGYHRKLQVDPLLRRNELWSLITFGGDIPLTPEIKGAAGIALQRTAAQVTSDILIQSEAYLYYLVTTAIPVLLEYDRSFGSSITELRSALSWRLDDGIQETRAKAASLRLLGLMT